MRQGATAVHSWGQLPQLVAGLVVLGGGEGERGGNATPWAEFNVRGAHVPHMQDAALERLHVCHISCVWRCGGVQRCTPGTPRPRHSARVSPRGKDVPPAPAQDPEAAALVIRAFGRTPPHANSPGGSAPRLLLLSWQCCERHLLPWASVDRLLAAAHGPATGHAQGPLRHSHTATQPVLAQCVDLVASPAHCP